MHDCECGGNCGCGPDCGCGSECDCGHDHHDHEHGEHKILHLSLEDGRELACIVVDIFQVQDKEYIALLPQDEEDVLLYEFREDEDGIELINIENDEEFELVSTTFMELTEDIEEEEE